MAPQLNKCMYICKCLHFKCPYQQVPLDSKVMLETCTYLHRSTQHEFTMSQCVCTRRHASDMGSWAPDKLQWLDCLPSTYFKVTEGLSCRQRFQIMYWCAYLCVNTTLRPFGFPIIKINDHDICMVYLYIQLHGEHLLYTIKWYRHDSTFLVTVLLWQRCCHGDNVTMAPRVNNLY